jgi:putative CocE/NonD family hydrolase
MKIVEQPPGRIRVIEHLLIPLGDGCRLAARVWLATDAESRPVPAILEYIPYRKRDGTRPRDEPMHGYFAGQGYAAVRVDMRGSGESDGLLHDEYLRQEQDDALEVIAWIARQPWCSGAVGMMGKSWGGFNALQVAARQPAALKAIITVCSTDDRYADDIHYMGGCLLNDNLWWGTIMLAYSARPPDPALVGEGWREVWLKRLAAMPFFPALWLAHQRRDAYWRHGSVCEDYAAIRCPVYAIGGWADGYSNAVPRLLAGLTVPRKGLIGPWAHLYPHDGVPGPAVGFLQEAVRWWDHWLKGHETGIMDEPMLRAWMQDYLPPQTTVRHSPGRWVAEASWPSQRIEPRHWMLAADGLTDGVAPAAPLTLASPQTVGMAAGEWSGFGVPGEMPADQRIDDGGSLALDSAPLAEPIEILGAPVVELEIEVDRPCALVCARLGDVAPDGAVARVSYGLLNLTHRDGHAEPQPLVPGERYRVAIAMNDIAHAFAAGHRVRLALSTSYWPLAWPSPQPVIAVVHAGASRLALPIRPARAADAELAPLLPPESAPPMPATRMRDGQFSREVTFDLQTGECRHVVRGEGGLFGEGVLRLDEIGTTLDHSLTRETRIRSDDPLSARVAIVQRYAMGRADWPVSIETRTAMSATAEAFELTGELDAYEGSVRVFSTSWRQAIPRDLV